MMRQQTALHAAAGWFGHGATHVFRLPRRLSHRSQASTRKLELGKVCIRYQKPADIPYAVPRTVRYLMGPGTLRSAKPAGAIATH